MNLIPIRYSFLTGMVFFLIANNSAQDTTDSLGYQYLETGRGFARTQKYDSALYYYGKASEFFYGKGNVKDYYESLVRTAYVFDYQSKADSLDNILNRITAGLKDLGNDTVEILIDVYSLKARYSSDYLSDYGSAVRFMQKAYEYAVAFYPENDISIVTAAGNLGVMFQYNDQLIEAIRYFTITADIVRANYGELHIYVASTYNNLGNIYLQTSDLDSARIMHEKALAIRLKLFGENHLHTAASYANLAIVASFKHDYQKALNYDKYVYVIRKEILGEMHPLVALAYNNMGSDYRSLGKLEKALECHLKALSVRDSVLPENHPDLAMSYVNLANIYNDLGKYETGLTYNQQAFQLKKNLYGEYHPDVAQILSNTGHTYNLLGDYQSAKQYFAKAVRNYRNSGPEYNPVKLLLYKNNLVDAYKNANESDSALILIEKILEENRHVLSYEKDQNDTIILDYYEYMRSLALKGKILFQLYNRDYDTSKLKESSEAYFSAAKQLSPILSEIEEEESMHALAGETSSVLDEAMNTTYFLYNLTRDSNLINSMFILSERSKNNILRNSITHTKALEVAGIPDSILKKEKDLRSEIQSLKSDLLLKEGQEGDQGVPESGFSYLTKKGEYNEFIAELEKTYPRYRQLKSGEMITSYFSVSERLDSGSLLLSYSIADTVLYIQAFSGESDNIISVSIGSLLKDNVETYIRGIKTFDLDSFYTRSRKLYKLLINPVEDLLSGKEELIIIPDKYLFFLHFETLCNGDEVRDPDDFSALPYLVKNYAINYNYSVSLYLNQWQKESGSGFLGFAPVFRSDSMNGYILSQNASILDTLSAGELALRSVSVNGKYFNELAGSEREIKEIINLFGRNQVAATGYFHSLANEETFRKEAPKSRYLHISTHGIVNEMYPELSGLILSQPQPEDSAGIFSIPGDRDGILHMSEIPGLNMNADLVVLSACETGLGKIVDGEGVISMTRSFLYAGARNIVFSLWKVGDKSTEKLMVHFYANILKGYSYSEALRQAKIKLIRDDYSYPLNWAGFTLAGISNTD